MIGIVYLRLLEWPAENAAILIGMIYGSSILVGGLLLRRKLEGKNSKIETNAALRLYLTAVVVSFPLLASLFLALNGFGK